MADELLALDSSCLVALAATWHERHTAVLDHLQRQATVGATFVVPAHVLVETYSVLTRVPAPMQLAPEAVLAFLDGNAPRWRIADGLPGHEMAAFLKDCASKGVTGGRVYDAAIAWSALRAGATAIVTLNPRHFRQFEAAGLAVVAP